MTHQVEELAAESGAELAVGEQQEAAQRNEVLHQTGVHQQVVQEGRVHQGQSAERHAAVTALVHWGRH